MSFLGYVTLGTTLYSDVVTRSTTNVPTNSDALPAYRIYGPDGLMTSGTGTGALRNTGSITTTTGNGVNPIVITSAAHGLTVGTRVTISGVVGNTAANGTFAITAVTTDTFSVSASGNGAYVSGGTWNVSGLYLITHAISSGNGYEAGTTYTILVSYAISSTSLAQTYTFIAS